MKVIATSFLNLKNMHPKISVSLHKSENRAQIIANDHIRKVGQANLAQVKQKNKYHWKLLQLYVDPAYSFSDSILNKIKSKINELKNEGIVNDSLNFIMSYMEKD